MNTNPNPNSKGRLNRSFSGKIAPERTTEN